MVFIHNMDLDVEQLQNVSYEGPDAFAAAKTRLGIKTTPQVPPQFDGQSSWFENEDVIDDWLGNTTLDADKQGPSLKNALISSFFLISGCSTMPYSEVRTVAPLILRTH